MEQLLDHGGRMRLEGFDLDVGEVLEEIHDRNDYDLGRWWDIAQQ